MTLENELVSEIIEGRQLRAARALLGWSQQELARHANVAASTVADFERGQRVPISDNLEALRTALEKAGIAFLPNGAVVGKPPSTSKNTSIEGVPIRWINATDLSQWAERRDAQGAMPELISKLISAEAGTDIRMMCFPAGDSIQQAGWDGQCEIERGTRHVPTGLSVWELSTEKGIKAKADKDYKKRSSELGADCARATFVFATPRRWSSKLKWKQEKLKERAWADIQVYDADDFVHWIERFPVIGQWLSVLMGKRPSGVQEVEEAWREWSLSTKWPMSTDVVLAGRDEDATKLLKWLYGEPSSLAVQAESPAEAIAFLYATIEQLPVEYRAHYMNRCLIARTPDVARTLADSPSPLIIVLDDTDFGIAARLAQRHHVYVAYGANAPENAMPLSRPTREALKAALAKMMEEKGANEDKKREYQEAAEKLIVECQRSLAVLRRLIPSAPGIPIPEWAKQDHGSKLVAALLAGAWDERKAGDRAVLERLSGEKYDILVGRFTRWLSVPDSPIRKVDSTWKLTSPRDAWFRLAHYISTADLDRFASVAVEVIGSADPRFEIEADKRWYASIDGPQPEYSGLLRTGLAEILVLLSIFGGRIPSESAAGERADIVIKKLLHGANAHRWWSLSRQLPVLAEASPDQFLRAVDESLSQNDPPIMALFAEDGGPFGAAHHTGLLWALETLAWSTRYLSKVALLLARLAQRDPGGRYANRPGNSLRHIFLLWLPQTNASLNERMTVLDCLREHEPDAAWKLMLGIFPTGHDSANNSPTPRWRDFTVNNREIITYPLMGKGADIISEKLLEDVKLNIGRWKQLIHLLPNFTPEKRAQALKQLSSASSRIKSEEDSARIWSALRKLLNHHRMAPDAQWALPEEELKPIEKIYAAFEPKDEIMRVAWLFSDEGSSLPNPTGQGWMADEEAVKHLRHTVVEKILSNGGADAIFALARAVQMPVHIGIALVAAKGDDAVKDAIFAKAMQDEDKVCEALTHGIILAKRQSHDNLWLDALLKRAKKEKWKSAVVLRMLFSLQSSKKIWDFATSMGKAVEEPYWSQTSILWASDDLDEIIFAVGKLIEVKRAYTAVHLAGRYAEKLPSQFLANLLTEAVKPGGESPSSVSNDVTMFQHYVEQILQKLDKSSDIPEAKIAELEWGYLPLLQHSRRPPIALHKALATSPAFFLDVLKALYKPKPGSVVEEEEPDIEPERAKALASHAFRLLSNWKQVPGVVNGALDAAALQEWVTNARQLCTKAGRADIGDDQIGKILAAAPADPDGTWPATPVRDVIEKIRSPYLEDGLFAGKRNLRGVTTRGMLDGGAQEKTLAEYFRRNARAVELKWPRTKDVLELLAKSYEGDGRRHDNEVERIDW